MIEQQATQVVVVGAGMSGLRAAQRLDHNGIDVVVLEARDRVGGRAHDIDGPDGATIEVGGQWVGPTQHAMHRVLAEFDLATFPTFDSGASVSQFGSGAATRFDGAGFGMNKLTLLDVGIAQFRLNRLISTIDPGAPWQHRHAERLDSQTLETWIRRNCRSQRARDFWRLITRAVFSCEADEVSLLHWLFYFRSGGGLDAVLDTTGGAQQDRIVGGPTTVARRLAAGLDVRLDGPVQQITGDDDGVVVRANGSTLRAERVIVAIPPALYGRIEFDPLLPGPKGQLSQHMPMGAVIKTHTYYDTPWWRADGLNGQALSPDRAVGVVFDNSPDDRSCGVLLGFFEGDHARQASAVGPDERRAIVEDDLVAFFGEQARESTGYVENDWCSEPWSGGAYAGRFTTGGWTTFGPTLRRPHGRIHFAGTETATVWNGYLDGAVSAGERVATEVAATIDHVARVRDDQLTGRERSMVEAPPSVSTTSKPSDR